MHTAVPYPAGLAGRLRTRAAAVGFALAMVVVIVGNTDLKTGENGGTIGGIVTGFLCVAVALYLFGRLLPRVQKAPRALLVLTILSVVSLAAFWAGLTPILASAAVALRSETGLRTRAATIGVPLAGVAAIASLVVTIAAKF